MKNLYSVLKYILLAGVLLNIACPEGWEKPKDSSRPTQTDISCKTSPCPDLKVQLLAGDRENVYVQVTNVGNQITTLEATVEAKFTATGHLDVDVEKSVSPLGINGWQADWLYSGWLGGPTGSVPTGLIISVYIWDDEPNTANNVLICYWNDKVQFWDCSHLPSAVVAQSGTRESTTSNSLQLLESKKELFKEMATTSALNAQGGFTGRFTGQVNGIDDTFALLGVEFVGSMIGLDFLPGMRLSACGISGPIYPFVEAANVTVTGNSFTTGPLETSNNATLTLRGTLSDDEQTLNLTMLIDPKDCDSQTKNVTVQRVYIPMDLTLELGSHPDGAFVGQNLKYAVSIRNNGRVTAQDAILSATVPASLTLIEPGGASCIPEGDHQVCSIPITRLDPGNSTTLDLSFNTINVKTKVLTTRFDLVVEGDPTLDIAPSDNSLAVSYPVTFMSDFSTSSVVDLPTTLLVGEDTMITLATTVKNAGPSSPISAVLKVTAIAPTDSTAVPNESTIELSDLAAPRTILQTYTVNCGEVGKHSFSFTTEIQPLNPEDLDPELSNNKATTSLDVECVFPVYLSPAGWHLFSMPAVPQDKQAEKFLNEIAGRYSIVLSFEEKGLSYDPALPSFSTLTTMDGEHGYWIYMEQDGFLTVRGQPFTLDTPITLEKGWNLVSYLPRTPLPVSQALVSIAGKYDKVLGYDRGATSYYIALQPPLNTLQVMERGKGYWIHMIEAGVLDYSKSSSVVQSAVTEAPNQPQYTDAIGATSKWVNIYSTNSTRNGSPLGVGTTVTAIGEDGRLLGQVTVREPGWYGVLAVYGADGSDSGFRGARVGEKIRFLIDGEPATISNAVEPTWTANGDLLQVDLTATGPEMNHHHYLPLVEQ